MSMRILTIIQFIEIFAAYLFMTTILPSMILYKKVAKYSICTRYFIYMTVGNFYMMNLVFILELLHISNRVTLVLFTLIPAIIAAYILNRLSLKKQFIQCVDVLYHLFNGHVSIKRVMMTVLKAIGRKILRLVKHICKVLRKHPVELVLFAAVLGYMVWYYTYNALYVYGYCASDLSVHNYWINGLSNNNIFVAGVYPFGFHCVIYYIHEVFNIDTYVLMRLFGVVQSFGVFMCLFAFIKGCCKTKYAVFLGFSLYICGDVFNNYATERFYYTLPQEFGMLFILPTAFFIFKFFEYRKLEKDIECRHISYKKKIFKSKRKACKVIVKTSFKKSIYYLYPEVSKQEPYRFRKIFKRRILVTIYYLKKYGRRISNKLRRVKVSSWFLIGCVLSFSMTLAAHFYDTMIAGLFCVAVAIAYVKRFLSPGYFLKIVRALIISILIAVAPMAIAYAQGTPLQASLRWGLSVMSNEDEFSINQDSLKDTDETAKQSKAGENKEAEGNIEGQGNTEVQEITELQENSESQENVESQTNSKFKNAIKDIVLLGDRAKQNAYIFDKVKYKLIDTFQVIGSQIHYALINENDVTFTIILACAFLLAVFQIIILGCLGEYEYMMRFLSSTLFVAFLVILFSAGALKLPKLMDANRSRIYLAYSIPILLSFTHDASIYILFGYFKRSFIMQTASLLCTAALLVGGFWLYPLRKPRLYKAFETNGAVTCLTNIIKTDKDGPWTIVSANDELQMAYDYGYHYELIDFIRIIELTKQNANLTIPTKTVYFFIEKKPIDYMLNFDGVMPEISEELAKKDIPVGSNISIYQGETRAIVMSKLYYWLQEYKKKYPLEMKLYYEDDQFVCYYIKQNEYNLYNFAIDVKYLDDNDTSVENDNSKGK